MAWSRQQNVTGIRNPAIRKGQKDPADLTTTAKDARAILRAQSSHTVPAAAKDVPIAANSRKADGFAPKATSPAQ